MAGAQMQVTLRPFDPDADFPGWVDLRNAVYPHNPVSVESARFNWNALDLQRYHRERQIAVEPGTERIIGSTGFGHEPEMFHADKYSCQLHVHPDCRRRGVGTQLWVWLSDRLAARGAILARASVWEEHRDAVAFAAKRGFRERRRAWQSILEVGAVDLTALAYRWERVREQGIVLTTLAEELPRDPDCLTKLYALAGESLRHMPLPDAPTDPPFEMFRQWIMASPQRIPEAFFIARDGERYVGVSFLDKSEKTGMINQGLTATDSAYMGRGIAWALKLHTVRYAQEHGHQQIQTWNDSANQRMLSINLRLGFRPLPAWIMLEREFER